MQMHLIVMLHVHSHLCLERVLEPPLDEIVAAHLRLVMNYFSILEQLENVTLYELLI